MTFIIVKHTDVIQLLERRPYKNNDIAAQTPRLRWEILRTAISENTENKPAISKQEQLVSFLRGRLWCEPKAFFIVFFLKEISLHRSLR